MMRKLVESAAKLRQISGVAARRFSQTPKWVQDLKEPAKPTMDEDAEWNRMHRKAQIYSLIAGTTIVALAFYFDIASLPEHRSLAEADPKTTIYGHGVPPAMTEEMKASNKFIIVQEQHTASN